MERLLVQIHLANKHGSTNVDVNDTAKFEWMLLEKNQYTAGWRVDWDKVVEVLPLLRENCTHQEKAVKRNTDDVQARNQNMMADIKIGNRFLIHRYAYASRVNSEMEVVNKKALSFIKSVASDYRLDWSEIFRLLGNFSSVMNEFSASTRRLPGRKKPRRPWSYFYVKSERMYIESVALPPVLECIHKEGKKLIFIDNAVLCKLLITFREHMKDYENKVDQYIELQEIKNKIRRGGTRWSVINWRWNDLERRRSLWGVSNNVYKMRVLAEKQKEIHKNMLHFYEPISFVTSEALIKIHIECAKKFEVKGLGDIKNGPIRVAYVIKATLRAGRGAFPRR
eukprot:augustus_masked-scaffold_46-processed-gene-1.107-mRNA-1 protein AED:1.00 eAED:1.00 QI:0/0/0/0/1/1/3/0/337